MKRPLIITIGILVILLVLGIWVYLLFFGTPNDVKEVPANLGFDFTSQKEVRVVEEIEETGYRVDTSSGLQQLTTRPVAGFTAYNSTTSSSTMVRYVEQGTGHIYDINLETGEEEIVSRTTIPRVREAIFSSAGQTVALISIEGSSKNTFLATINTAQKQLEGENLAPNVENIHIPNEGAVQYTALNDSGGLTGYLFDLESGQLKEEFIVPFTEINVIWEDNSTFFYNKSDDSLIGYLYDVNDGSYTGTEVSGYGLVVESNEEYIGHTYRSGEGFISEFINTKTNDVNVSPSLIIPEKCDFMKKDVNSMVCAIPRDPEIDLGDWYKGKISTNDELWVASIASSTNTLINRLEESSGRPIDVKNLSVVADDKLVLFSNKLDNTLWKFDI